MMDGYIDRDLSGWCGTLLRGINIEYPDLEQLDQLRIIDADGNCIGTDEPPPEETGSAA